MANREQVIQELVGELLTRTTWPRVGQPAASTFFLEKKDLEIIKPYSAWDYDGKKLIKVRHMACKGEIEYDPHPTDPIFSKYRCDGFSPESYYRCDWQWEVRQLQGLSLNDLRHYFYTELCEDTADLGEWPIKLCEKEDGRVRYTTTRPVTKEELLRKRVERLLDIRGVK